MNNWLYTEPYTLLFKSSKECLFYNTLDNSKLVITIDEKNQLLLEALVKHKCVPLTNKIADTRTTKELISLIQNSYNGDIIPIENDKCRPAVFNPIINNQRAFEKLDTYDWIKINSEVMNYLEEIFLYINGFKEGSLHDIELYKQVPSYVETDTILDLSLHADFFKNIIDKQINRINILGGNILLHPHFGEIIDLSRKKAHIVNFHFRYDQWKPQFKKIFISEFDELTLICPVYLFKKLPFNPEGLSNSKYAKRTRCVFIIQNEGDYEIYENIIQQNEYITNHRCLPFYNGANRNFFESIIFTDKYDIEDISLTKREVYVNQKINNRDFGRITILPDGNVFANVNFPPIGYITDKIHDILYNELKTGMSWLRIRDKKPCNDCVYQFLCPPPSNYEFALQKNNLCHIHP